MEMPNRMPNGMGGGNNMNMTAMNSMQRPQSGNGMQQIHAAIMEHLRGNLGQLPQGWQQTFDVRERANRIMQMVTQLRQLDSQINKCINIAENWEQRTIAQCHNKEQYVAQWNQKLGEITQKRQTQAAQTNPGMPQNNMGNMHNLNNMNMMQNGGMNGMNGMGGMAGMNPNFNGMGMGMPNGGHMGMPNQMNMGQQGGFPQQLQRQMQPSPMPPQMQQPQNGSIDPSALMQNPQMQNHMPNQMSQPPQQQRQQQQPPPNVNPNQGGPPNGPSDNEVKQVAKRMYDSASEDQKKQLRAQVIASLNDQQRQTLQARGVDPLNRWFMGRAKDSLMKQRQQQQNGGMNVGAMGNNMQQHQPQPGQPNFDFSSIMGQQANAIKSQESGGEVVPASNNMMQQGGNNQQPMNFNQNGNPNGGNNQQMLNMQFAQMQEKQKREQMAKKNQMAQQQAMAQQNQLRGQPGGLNAPNALNGGQVNSPAMNMNMLNRPTFPPGQTTPSTPHQNMQGHPPQTPSTGAGQLAQHHQNMLNQNQNHGQMGIDNMHPQQRQFMSSLPLEAQQKLASLPREQVDALLARYAAQRSSAMMPPGGGQHPSQMGMGMGQSMQNQPSMGAGGMSNAVPGFNAQPPPHQQQQDPNAAQAGLQQKMQQQQQAQLRQRAQDLKPYPKQVVQTLGLSVPDFVNTWGKLRQHIAQNQGVLPQDLMGRLTGMQNQWFDTHPEELKSAVEDLKRMVFAQSQAQRQQEMASQGQQAGPPGMQMPNGQAPQAQMVAPPAQMQQPPPPNQAPNNQHISQENVNALRAKFPNAKNMTDDQIRTMMMRRRNGQQAQANQDMQQNLRNAQMNAQMQQHNQQPMGAAAQPTPQQGGQRPQGAQQGQGQKRGNSDDVVEIPNPNPPSGNPMPQSQQNQQQQRGNMPQMPNVPGLKNREQLAAMPDEQRNAYIRKVKEMQALRNAQIGIGASQQPQQNAPQMQQQPPQQPPPPPQQGRQPATGNQVSAETQQNVLRIRQLFGEVQASNPKGPEVQLDQRSLQQAKELLKKLWTVAHALDRTLIAGFAAFGEDRVREAIKIKQIVLQNAADSEGNIRDFLGVSVETLKRSEQFISAYLGELRSRQQAQNQAHASQEGGKQGQANAQPTAQQQKQPQPAQGKQATPAAPQKGQAAPPLNRKSSSQHVRKASNNNKAPPAPTENKTFDWASPTPHGVPKYDPGRTELTADKLRFPPQKKRKTTDSQGSTPAAQTGTPGPPSASPQITSGPKRDSPEQMRKMPPQQAEPEKPRFTCEDVFCQASAQGFESEEQLQKHKDEEHKPIEDPLQFVMETVDSGLTAMGADKNGKPLPAKAAVQPARRAPAAQKVADRKAAASATPALKAESATPATPASNGKSAIKPGLTTPAGKKPATAAETKAPEGEKTLYDTLVEQLGIELPPAPKTKAPARPATPDTPLSPWTKHLANLLAESQGRDMPYSLHDDDDGMDDWNAVDWNNTTAFGLPRDPASLRHGGSSDSDSSPELTPASSVNSTASHSEVNISEAQRLKMVFEWDPSGGNGATQIVPEKLRNLALNEEAGDTGMGEEGENGEGTKKQKEKDPWNWDSDLCDWDSLFGAQRGVEDDGGFGAIFGSDRDAFKL